MLNDGQERLHPEWRRFATGVRCCRQHSISRLFLPACTSLPCAGKAKTGTYILHTCSRIFTRMMAVGSQMAAEH